MDEYISRNELLKVVHSNVAEAHNERCAQLLEAILLAPIADVVPKSELEQLQRKYDLAVAEREANVKGFTEELEKANAEIDRLKYNLKAVLDEIPETKRELASEIFADIEKCRVVGVYGIHAYLKDDIAELKKKYTEETK